MLARTEFLTLSEERALAERWLAERHEPSMHRLVEAHAPLVGNIARRYKAFGLPKEDLLQEGMIALVRAAETYEPARGLRFATYASFWVRGTLRPYIVRNAVIVSGKSSNRKAADFFRGGFRARDRGISIEGIVERRGRCLVSDEPSPEELTTEAIDGARRVARLHKAVARLPERERIVITERWLGEVKGSLESIGAKLGISKERARQLESRALGLLREAMA